jgi:hypothetical protein
LATYKGVWVFSTGKPMTSDETAEALRDLRDRKNLWETK